MSVYVVFSSFHCYQEAKKSAVAGLKILNVELVAA